MGKENWSNLNSSLFSICFTAKGKFRSKCDDCLGAGHSVSQCPFKKEQQPVPSATGNPEDQILKGVALGQGAKGSMMETVLIYVDYSLRHACARCNGKYPAIACKGLASELERHSSRKEQGSFPPSSLLIFAEGQLQELQ